MKRKRTIGELLELAKRDQPLNLGSESGILATLECIIDKWDHGVSLSEEDQDMLVQTAKEHMLSARQGHPEGPSHELNRARQCVTVLMQIGSKVHGVVPPHRTPAPLVRRIAARAIQLVEQRFPELRGLVEPPRGQRTKDPSDIRNYKWKPTKVMVDYVDEQFPEARAQMRDLPAPTRR